MTAPGSRIVVDVDRLLQARYLAAVVKELEALPMPVDAVVLGAPGRPGGRVVLRDQGAGSPASGSRRAPRSSWPVPSRHPRTGRSSASVPARGPAPAE